MTTNTTRADRAADTLAAHVPAKCEPFQDRIDGVIDLMADLLHLTAHYAAEDGGDVEAYIEKALRLAKVHFDAEHGNPEEDEA